MTVAVACKSKDDESSLDDADFENGGDAADNGSDDDESDDDESDDDIDGNLGGLDGDSEPTGMETGTFLGQMAAAWSAEAQPSSELPDGVVLEEVSCQGAVSFDVETDMSVSGSAGCTVDGSSVPVLNFDISGTQTDLALEGTLTHVFFGTTIITDFTGTRDGDDVEISFDQVHNDGGNIFEIAGTITASLAE